MKILIASTMLFGLTTWTNAEPLYFGAFGGLGLASTSNTLLQGGSIVGEFPIVGTTTGSLAGVVAGYGHLAGPVYLGVDFSVARDFSSGCYSIDCAAERHPGWLMQQVGEIGIPWNGLLFTARAGVAERTNNLSAFDDRALQRDYGNGWTIGPDVGAELRFAVDTHIALFVSWDHVWWKGYSASTPAYQDFQNSVAISHEEVFKVGVSFH